MGQPNTKSYSPYTKGQWEWKSNPNPYSRTEKAEWTPYKPLENYMLEMAFYNQQKEVDLGDHIVSIKDMLQKRKGNVHQQRPIRRYTNHGEKKLDGDENVRAKRFFGAETPKTFNQVFGSLSDYLKFFKNRSPDIKDFAKLLDDIETTGNLGLLNKIVQPCLINCLQNESKKNNSQKQNQQQLLQLFEGTVENIHHFYANVLKAYTMESFLYRSLNNYLRNEDWIQLDSLLPYAYCLCKAFLRSEFTSNVTNEPEQNFMTVYRGAQFDEATLSFYDVNTVKNFCWNSVTSTSRSHQVAEGFMYYNFDPRKVPVLFIIEVPLDLENANKWIDIKPYSAIPNEDEIVLPPGSVFELIGVFKNGQKCVEINLRLMVDVKRLAHQRQIMYGTMHSEMGNETSLKLVCLEGRELSGAVAHLKGNRLMEELEFSLCKFGGGEIALEKLPKLKSVAFISSFAGNEAHWEIILKHLEKISIEKLQISDCNFNDNLLSILGQGVRSLKGLKSLALTFPRCSEVTDEGLKNLTCEGLKYGSLMTSLALNFSYCENVTDEGVGILACEGLRNLTSLTDLALDFTDCFEITDEALKNLTCEGLKDLVCLKSLSLNFEWCRQITDKGLNDLSFQGLKNLTALALDFTSCHKITCEGFHGLGILTSLKSLSLKFGGCYGIGDAGLKSISSQGLKFLGLLGSLSLDFGSCKEITDEGLKNLASEGLKNRTLLTSLALNFSYCENVTDEGLRVLACEGLKYMSLLKSLSMKFGFCDKITDEGVKDLIYEEFEYLPSLTSLALDFQKRNGIANERLQMILELKNTAAPIKNYPANYISLVRKLNNRSSGFQETILNNEEEGDRNPMVFKGKEDFDRFIENSVLDCKNIAIEGDQLFIIQSLIKEGVRFTACLASLTLDLGNCSEITEKELNLLFSEGLGCFTLLTNLKLNCVSCKQITNEGLNNLACQGLKTLTSLTSLALNFSDCEVTDKGLKNLACEGLKFLTTLTSLTLSLGYNNKLTDEGLKILGSQGLKYLSSLTSLNLNFNVCKQITDEGLKNLACEGLRNLTLLDSLILSFDFCDNITDEGLTSLCSQGLRFLASLESLTLNFEWCKQLTDEGLNNLISEGLKYLISLRCLTLQFGSCSKIRLDAWKNFCKMLKYLGYEVIEKDALI